MKSKMYQEKFNLTWDTYPDHLRNMLLEMMNSSYLTDVTLVCDDKKQFKAHKIVLSACSTTFRNIIDGLHQDNPVIYLRGIQHEEMRAVLDFIYLGSTTLCQERLKEFLDVSKSLEINEVSKCFDKDTNDENIEEEWLQKPSHQKQSNTLIIGEVYTPFEIDRKFQTQLYTQNKRLSRMWKIIYKLSINENTL